MNRPAFKCSEAMRPHCEAVMAGCYDVPGLQFDSPPRILDCGACYGDFAVWAAHRWGTQSFIQCYEPNPHVFRVLQENIGHVGAVSHPVAVSDTGGRRLLRFGKNNEGEASLHDIGEQREDGVGVECIPAGSLPDCDVLKVDTEGCEVEILRGYFQEYRREVKPRAVLLEFHSAADRLSLDRLLDMNRYHLVRGTIVCADRGTLCYMRTA